MGWTANGTLLGCLFFVGGVLKRQPTCCFCRRVDFSSQAIDQESAPPCLCSRVVGSGLKAGQANRLPNKPKQTKALPSSVSGRIFHCASMRTVRRRFRRKEKASQPVPTPQKGKAKVILAWGSSEPLILCRQLVTSSPKTSLETPKSQMANDVLS